MNEITLIMQELVKADNTQTINFIYNYLIDLK